MIESRLELVVFGGPAPGPKRLVVQASTGRLALESDERRTQADMVVTGTMTVETLEAYLMGSPPLKGR